MVKPGDAIRRLGAVEIHCLKTPQAISLYNELRRHKRVAIHLHSTC